MIRMMAALVLVVGVTGCAMESGEESVETAVDESTTPETIDMGSQKNLQGAGRETTPAEKVHILLVSEVRGPRIVDRVATQQ